jgi:hypothetical protein
MVAAATVVLLLVVVAVVVLPVAGGMAVAIAIIVGVPSIGAGTIQHRLLVDGGGRDLA